MKKNYISPVCEVMVLEAQQLLAGSGVSGGSGPGSGIGYGGVDDGGSKDPSARYYYDLLDDWDE